MAGVYNRKLFRQASARDELRKIGGIMASSEELLREAMRTAEQAPRPSDLGPMAMPARQPAMQQPMMPPMGMTPPPMTPMQQPMMPLQQPMMQPQQPMMPMQQPMAEPAYMPAGVPQSAQPPMMQPMGFAEGGEVSADEARKRALLAAAGAGGFIPDLSIGAIDVGAPAGSVVEAPSVDLDEDVVATAESLSARVDDEDPEVIGAEIVDKAAEKGLETTGDLQADLAGVYQQLTGDPAAYEKNIDALNRGIIGAAIGAGTSARATENISKGLLVGLETARDTEERRVRDARALQLAQLQARAAEAKAAAGDAEGAGSRNYRNPVDAYQDAYQAVINAGEFDIEVPEGMTREQYADQVATDLIRRSYSAEQLVGSPFEGLSAPAEAPTQAGEDVLQSARAAIAAGADEAAVRERLQSLGIDPERL